MNFKKQFFKPRRFTLFVIIIFIFTSFYSYRSIRPREVNDIPIQGDIKITEIERPLDIIDRTPKPTPKPKQIPKPKLTPKTYVNKSKPKPKPEDYKLTPQKEKSTTVSYKMSNEAGKLKKKKEYPFKERYNKMVKPLHQKYYKIYMEDNKSDFSRRQKELYFLFVWAAMSDQEQRDYVAKLRRYYEEREKLRNEWMNKKIDDSEYKRRVRKIKKEFKI